MFCSQDRDNWHLFELIARAQGLRQGTLTIMEYALAHKSLWDEVDYYLPVDVPLCQAFQNTLHTRLLGFLNGLNKEYVDIRRRALCNKGGLPTIDSLVKELQEEETGLRVHGNPAVDASHESTALLAMPSPPSALDQPSSAMICSYWGRSGHLRNRCCKRHHDNQQKKNGKEAKAMVAQSAPPPPSTSSSIVEQLQANLAHLTAQVTAMHAPTPIAFFDASTPSSSHEWYCGQSALTSPLVSDTTWVLDSGATEHVTPFNSRFVSYQRHVGGRPVLTASGSRLPVLGIGVVYVAGLGVIHHILHVPSLRAILLSPQRLVDTVLCSFHLQPDGMFLSDKVGRTTLIRRAHGLLLLDDMGPVAVLHSAAQSSPRGRAAEGASPVESATGSPSFFD